MRLVALYSFLLIMLVHVHIAVALFLNSCPNKVMWNLRAQNMCGDQDKYMCLYDTNARKFMELCKDKPDFHRPGNIFVISGNLQYFAGRPCYYNRYQPHKWWTNGSHECQYLKSTCNEEGQVPYDNGTISRDKKCRCDYTNYYTFLNDTRSRCHCDPIEEDCSCYRKTCNTGEVLTPDYECVSVHAWTGMFVCPEHKAPRYSNEKTFQRRTTVCPSVERDLSGTMQQSIARIAQTVMVCVIMMFGLISLIVYAIKYKTSKLSKGMESKLEEFRNKLKKFESHIGDMDQSTNNTADSPFDDLNRIILEDKWEACAIVLCILFGNEFNTDWLKSKLEAQDKKAKLQGIVNEFEINLYNETAIEKLISAFASLDGTYLQGSFTTYKISNSKNYQQISVICGKSFTECFIKHGSSTLIRDHFLFDSIRGEHIQDGLMTISKDNECLYFERLLSDLRKLNIKSTFENKQLKYPSFMNKLIRFFEKSEDTKQLLKKLDKNIRTVEEDEKKSRGSSATTPLIESASGGYVDIVYFLIDTVKSEVNNRDGEGSTALYKASEAGNTNVVQLLLEKNANVNQYNMYNESPLYVACKAKHCGIVDILLQNNASVSQCTISNKSPLYEACAEGGNDIVELLLKKDADVNQCDDTGKSPLYVACAHGYTYIVNVLLQKVVSQLDAAADESSHELVDPLLQNVVDVNQSDNDEESPLYVACVRGYTDIVEILLKTEVDVNKCNIMQDSPLNIACMSGYIEIVECLLSKAANVNICNLDGESPLHMACTGGHKDIVEMLLKKEADVTQCDNNKNSPLNVACDGGYTDIIEMLLKKNPDVNQCDSDEKYPLHVACGGGYTDIVKMLLNEHANINQYYGEQKEFPLYLACAGGYKDIVEMLLNNGADVCQCNIEEETPLFVACAMGYTAIVELLLHRNSKASQCNKAGSFPLYVACARGRTDIVKMLLQKDPDVLLCTKPENSPLHVVCDFDSFKHLQYSKHGKDVYEKKVKDHIAIVELLISCKVDASKMDSKQQTPLDIAKKSGCSELINILDNLS